MRHRLLLTTLVIAIVAFATAAKLFDRPFGHMQFGSHDSLSQDSPLVLDEYLHNPNLAKSLAETRIGDWFSYSGFFTVNPTYNSNMFFWYFPAQSGDPNAPVLLWLQGGPGGSSLFGLFAELGPITLDEKMNLIPMNITWNTKYSLLFIDNPVGTGFSYTDAEAGYSHDMDSVSQNLYTTVSKFFTMFPELSKNDFYVTGESYAGKYVPALSYKIWQENQAGAQPHINLKGIAIGDGLCDPRTQVLGYADLAYSIGLADELQRDYMVALQLEIIETIDRSEWHEASTLFTKLINGPPDYYTQITGSEDYYDIRRTTEPWYPDFATYVNQPSIRALLHVGNRTFQDGNKAGDALFDDIPKSIKPLLPTLLANYRVMFYNGQYDFIVAPLTTELFLRGLQWSGLFEYNHAARTIWKVQPADTEVAGYVRQAGNLTQVIVRSAGHILPGDQPRSAYDMIDRFVSQRSWSS